MKRCSVKPYEGASEYVFVSYCHKDKKYVFPIIEQLAHDGYRVWYDEGIDPGSEWPEIIAEHLNGCSVCLAIISNNSLNSHNCRREINYALLKKKMFIYIVIEEVQMSPGMEMQLSATQGIFKYKLPTETEFFNKLYDAKLLANSFGVPNPGIRVSRPEDYDLDEEQGVKYGSDRGKEEKYRSWFERIKTNEEIVLSSEEFKLGRSKELSNYQISGNSTVSRVHVRIVERDGKHFVIDNKSTNKTYLNTKELEPLVEYALEDGDTVCMSNEAFVYHHVKEQE